MDVRGAEAIAATAAPEARAAPRPRRIYHGWWIVLLGFFLQVFAAGPIYYAYGNYALAFEAEYGASRTAINFAYTMLIMIGALGSAPVGWLADRWPIPRLAMIGVIGASLGLALVGATSAMWQVLLLFATLIAASDVFIGNVISNFLISHWFERRRGLALGLSIVGASVAAIIFPPLTSGLFDEVGWRATFLIYGVATLMLSVPVMLLAKVPPSMPDVERRERTSAMPPSRRMGFRHLVRFPAFWIISLCTGSMIGVNGAVMISIVPYAAGRGFSMLDAAFLVSLMGGGALIGKLCFGFVADRINLAWALRAGLLLMALGLMLLLIDGSYALLCATSVLFGLGLGGMLPVWASMVAHIFGLASCGSAMGGTRAAMTPLTFAGPMIAGYVFDRTGGYDLAWAIFAAMLLTAMAVTFIRDWSRQIAA